MTSAVTVGVVTGVCTHPASADTTVSPTKIAHVRCFAGSCRSSYAINDLGTALAAYDGAAADGQLVTPSNATVVNQFDTTNVLLLAVNDHNLAVGTANEAGINKAVTWQVAANNPYTVIPVAGLDSHNGAQATAVDDAGEIAVSGPGGAAIYASASSAAYTAVPDPTGAGGTVQVMALNQHWEVLLTIDPNTFARVLYRVNRSSGAFIAVPGGSDYLVGLSADGTTVSGGVETHPDGTQTTLGVTYPSISTSGVVVGNEGSKVVRISQDGTTTDLAALTGLSLSGAAISPGGRIALYTPVGADQTAGDAYDIYALDGSKAEPTVNSTGDMPAKNGGSDGCDTGRTVTVDGASKTECTLRAAIQAENAGSVDAKSITFALPTGSSTSIALTSALTALTASGVTIDGTTGQGGTVTIDGTAVPQGQAVVHVSGGQDVVQGVVPQNATIGVLIDGSAGHDTVRASSLGVTPGSTTALGLSIGVKVSNSPAATIGGTGAADRNVFGSLALGVLVTGAGASGAVVQGNDFGTDSTGNDIPVSAGVEIVDASGATVGGATGTVGAAPGNVFDGLSQGGVNENGSSAIGVIGNAATVSGTTIAGNLIGFHTDGATAGSSHFADGVLVGGKLSGTTIGGTSPGSGNVIAGAAAGQVIVSGTSALGTQVLGNLIGTDATGTKIVAGSVGIGVHAAPNTTVGLPGAGRNVVAGGQYGILTSATSTPVTPGTYASASNAPALGTDNVTVTTAMNTTISGNIVGPGSDGTTVDPDHIMTTGVALAGIGETLGPNNQIAFAKTGVNISNRSETVYGNLIGTDPNGTNAIPNGVGVFAAAGKGVTGMLSNGVPTVKIGVAGQKRNVISGNTTDLMLAAPAQVQNNLIGTVANGKSAIGAYAGTIPDTISYGAGIAGVLALAAAGSANSIIGGAQPGMGNVISGGPAASGSVQATGGLAVLASNVTVQGNYVGVGNDGSTAVPNAGYGIKLGDGATDTVGASLTDGKVATGGGNIVAHNGAGGIVVDSKIVEVRMLSNSVHDNTGGGIVLTDSSSNSGISAPTISAAVQDAANTGASTDHTVVFGTGSAPGATVQVFAAANCPTAEDDYTPGQGATLLASSTLGAQTIGGGFSVPVPVQPVGTKLVVTSTDSRGTSAFSSCVAVAPSAKGTNTKRATSPGNGQTADGSGFTPGEPVSGSVHSTPIALGTKNADSTGDVAFTFTVPSSLERGDHYVLLTGQQSGASVAVPFTVYVTPTAPRTVKAVAGKASATLAWLAPSDNGGSAVTGYQVLRSTNKKTWTLRATTNTAKYTDTGLHGGTRYYYELRAVNAAGSSASSTIVSAVPYAAPSAPRSLHAKAGVKAVTLSWTAPASNGAAIAGYIVDYATCKIGAHGCTAHVLTTTSRSRTIGRLTAGKHYYFAVRAVNKGGQGTLTTVVSAVPKK